MLELFLLCISSYIKNTILFFSILTTGWGEWGGGAVTWSHSFMDPTFFSRNSAIPTPIRWQMSEMTSLYSRARFLNSSDIYDKEKIYINVFDINSLPDVLTQHN